MHRQLFTIRKTDSWTSGRTLTKVRVENLHYDITENELVVCVCYIPTEHEQS